MNRPTPRASGYRMPAEWEAHEAVWLSWPTNPDTWPGDLASAVVRCYVELVRVLAHAETVSLLVDDAEAEAAVAGILQDAGVGHDAGVGLAGVRFVRIPSMDTWIRDYGPTFLADDASGRTAMVDWTFNAWGDKYPELRADDGVPAAMNRLLGLPLFEAGIVLEGGSIEVNGRGTVLTTEQCLLHPNRNPELDRAGIEEHLREYLGASNILWLGEGIVGDDTDGHVDDIARFADPHTILTVYEDDPADENHRVLQDNYARLEAMRDQDGGAFRIVTVPMPDPVSAPEGRLPASYVNFYIANGVVAVPVFGQQKDRCALEVIQSCFPRHRVAGVDCTALVNGLGTIHCCTQQQPRSMGSGSR